MTAEPARTPCTNPLRVAAPGPMCYYPRPMSQPRTDLYFGIFQWESSGGYARVIEPATPPPAFVPDPRTGRRLRISTIQASTPAICPACSCHADGGFVSFEDDLRIAYACPQCREFVWIKGA